MVDWALVAATHQQESHQVRVLREGRTPLPWMLSSTQAGNEKFEENKSVNSTACPNYQYRATKGLVAIN